MFIPNTIKDLVPEGVEIRPIPGYNGFFMTAQGTILTIILPYSSTSAMHPRYARIVPENQGIKIMGKERLYKQALITLTFPEGIDG